MKNRSLLSQIDSQTTALVLIDLQKGIIALPVEPYTAKQVIDNARKLAESSHTHNLLVI